MIPPKVDEYDYIQFLLAAQRVFSTVEASKTLSVKMPHLLCWLLGSSARFFEISRREFRQPFYLPASWGIYQSHYNSETTIVN